MRVAFSCVVQCSKRSYFTTPNLTFSLLRFASFHFEGRQACFLELLVERQNVLRSDLVPGGHQLGVVGVEVLLSFILRHRWRGVGAIDRSEKRTVFTVEARKRHRRCSC